MLFYFGHYALACHRVSSDVKQVVRYNFFPEYTLIDLGYPVANCLLGYTDINADRPNTYGFLFCVPKSDLCDVMQFPIHEYGRVFHLYTR
jgi:hypothetical protein